MKRVSKSGFAYTAEDVYFILVDEWSGSEVVALTAIPKVVDSITTQDNFGTMSTRSFVVSMCKLFITYYPVV